MTKVAERHERHYTIGNRPGFHAHFGQYAAVKMRLFHAFDELEEMQAQGRQLQIDSQSLEESLAALGVE